MALEFGLDTAVTPTQSQLQQVHDAWNATTFGVYVGGGCVYMAWDAEVVQWIIEQGWGVIPYYVGQQTARICQRSNLTYSQGQADYQDALNCLAKYGLSGARPCLDVEAGTYSDHPTETLRYVQGFCGSGPVDVYSSPSCLKAIGEANGPKPVCVVGADYPAGPSTNPNDYPPANLPGLGSLWSNHQRAWQFTDQLQGAGKTWDGLSVDMPMFRRQSAPQPQPIPTPTPRRRRDMTPASPLLLPDGTTAYFVVGKDKACWVGVRSPGENQPHAWLPKGGQFISGLSAAITDGNNIEVIGEGTDEHYWRSWGPDLDHMSAWIQTTGIGDDPTA